MGKIVDIFGDGSEEARRLFDSAEAAADLTPLPRGTYVCHVLEAKLIRAKTGTQGCQLTFKVLEGEHADRRVWHELWITDKAVAMTKRELGKLGVVRLEQLEKPLPQGIRCKVEVVLRQDDEGFERNRVRDFVVVGWDQPTPDPFAPGDSVPDDEELDDEELDEEELDEDFDDEELYGEYPE
jgi:hypothetical protein